MLTIIYIRDCDKSVTEVVIPSEIKGFRVVAIGTSAFTDCRSLTSVTIPSGVQEIGDNAFYGCTKLTSVTIPDSVTIIRRDAFRSCGLISVTIPNSVIRIGQSAFQNCALTSVIIPDTVTEIAPLVFSGCTSLTNVTIGNGVTSIGGNAFSGCSSLTSVSIPNSVTSIGGGAFYHCAKLISVIIPNSVTSIGGGAFSYCNNLTDVYYSGSETDWKAISIGTSNTYLTDAKIHYNSTGPDQPIDPDVPSGEITMQVFPSPYVGGTTTMTATISNPGSLQQSDITWNSSNETVATITPGTVTPNIYGTAANATADIRCISKGTTTITIKLADGRSASYDLEVAENPTEEPQNEIQLSGNRSLLVGSTATLNAKITLNVLDVTDSIEWTSSNGAILAFDRNGNSTVSRPISGITIPTDSVITDSVTIYGRSPGKAKVTCKLLKSGVEESFEVSVYSEESQALQDRTNDWMTAFYNYVDKVVNLLGENKNEGLEATKEEQARALMAADQASRDRLVTFTSRTDERNEEIALPVYMAVVDMLAEEAGNEFDLGNVDVSGANKDEYLTTVAIKIVKKVQNMINTKPYEYQYNNVFISLSGISMGTDGRFRWISYAVNDPNNSRLVAQLGSRRDELQATLEAYLKELAKLEKNAINEVYTQMVKSVFNKSLSELIKTGVKEKITDALGKHIDKFTQTGAGNVATAISTSIDYYKYVDKIVKFANHDPAELLLDLSSMEKLKFESTSIKDKTVKAAMKSLETAKDALEKAIKEYADTGKIDWGASAVGWAKGTFSGIKSIFKCPVNIAVYDSTGEQVGYVGDDDLWYDDSVIYIEKYGDVKTVYSNNAALRFEVIGSNYGMLNCTFEEYSNGTTVGRINYYDIPIYNGSTISAEVADKAITNQNVIVAAEGTDVITADEIIISEEYEDTTVNIAVNVEQGGSVIGDGEYIRGDTVNLQAVAGDGYAFQGWKNSNGALVSISQVYEFTAKEDVILTASFAEHIDEDELSFYVVTFNATGGSVDPTYLATEYNGKLEYLPTPNRDGYTFEGWYTRLEDGTKVTTNTKFTEDTTVYAHWTIGETPIDPKPTYTITLNASPVEGGTVTGSGTYNKGQTVTVKATPANNYRFVCWMESGTIVSTSTIYTFNIAANRTLTAVFEQIGSSGGSSIPDYSSSSDSGPSYSITIPSRVTGGTVKVSPTSASERQRITLTVKPNSGYELAKLTVTDNKGTEIALTNKGDGKYTFTMPKGNVSVDAQFQRIATSGTPVQPATPSQSVSANPTNDNLEVDGKAQTPAAYKINGYNYFKLRDVAALLNGTIVNTLENKQENR